MASAAFTDLPAEVIGKIYSRLQVGDRYRLSQTCKYAAHVAQVLRVFADVPYMITSEDDLERVLDWQSRKVQFTACDAQLVIQFGEKFAERPYALLELEIVKVGRLVQTGCSVNDVLLLTEKITSLKRLSIFSDIEQLPSLSRLAPLLSALVNLQELEISGFIADSIDLEQIGENGKTYPKMKRLTLGDDPSKEFPESLILAMPNLVSFEIPCLRQRRKVPYVAVATLRNLTRLDLTDACLSYLPDVLSNLSLSLAGSAQEQPAYSARLDLRHDQFGSPGSWLQPG